MALTSASVLLLFTSAGMPAATAIVLDDADSLKQTQIATARGLPVDQHAARDITLTQQLSEQTDGVNTTLEVDDVAGPISFTNSGVVQGTLRTTNGAPIANERIRIEVENRTRLVETDADGGFSFQYRPRSAQTGTTDVQVRYIPDQSSGYRADTASFTATVRQVTPTLSLERSPSRLGYGDELTITTTVRVDGAGVSAIPVELRIDGTLFKRVVTGRNGTVTTTIRFPADITAEDQDISAVIPYENRSIAGKRTSAPLTVESTPVTLSMNTTHEADAITVNGTVSTEDGERVSNQPVQILIDGAPRGSVPTDQNGRFSTQLTTDTLPEGASAVTVTARYDEAGTNLAATETSAAVDLPGGGGTGPTAAPNEPADGLLNPQAIISQIRSFLTVPVISALVTGIILVVLDITVRRLGLFSDDVPASEEGAVTTERDDPPVREVPDGDESQTPATTEMAESQRTEIDEITPTPTNETMDGMGRAIAVGEYESAVTLAYETMYDQLTETLELQDSMTHEGLLERCEDSALSAAQVESVRTVVEAYDRAIFSADQIDRSTAERAVECTRQFRSDSR